MSNLRTGYQTMNAEQLIDRLIESGFTPRDQLDEGKLLDLLWRKLPSNIKSKVDIKKLADFIGSLVDGVTLSRAAGVAKIPLAIAVDLLSAVEGAGLL